MRSTTLHTMLAGGLALCYLASILGARGSRREEEKPYNVVSIPAHLLQKAKAIVRTNVVEFEIRDERRARMKVRRAVTIFDKDRREEGELLLWYDSFREIEELEGTIFDANGNEIRGLEKADIKDYGAFSSSSFYPDTRIRLAQLYHDLYPYTVEFVYELSFDGSLNWPEWYARHSIDAVQFSKFVVSISPDQPLRFWCSRDSIKPAIAERDGKQLFEWEASNLPSLSEDEVGDVEDVTTVVKIAPGAFQLEGYDGDMTSWKNFGAWFYKLTVGRNKLPQNAAQEAKALVRPEDDRRETIRRVYEYMQSRTRYVSVQLGIGGWQPLDATYVHERGYGDCKALSNYMAALLREAGIPSYPVLIHNGNVRYPMISEFPSNQFNHVILCVPLERDTLWLECTSQSIPMGDIGDGNENRPALMITPEGGVVVTTPASSARANAQRRTATVNLLSSGSGEASVTTVSAGNQRDRVREALLDASPQDQQRWILEGLQTPNATLKGFEIEGLGSRSPEVAVKLHLSLARLASASGTRIFFQPNLMERRTNVPPDVRRRSPIRLRFVYVDTDSILFRFPDGYAPEAIPAPVSLNSSFASFTSRCVMSGDTSITFLRTLEVFQRIIPTEHYPEYRKFFADIVKADRAQVVLARKGIK